jgi:hypothetical protein
VLYCIIIYINLNIHSRIKKVVSGYAYLILRNLSSNIL